MIAHNHLLGVCLQGVTVTQWSLGVRLQGAVTTM